MTNDECQMTNENSEGADSDPTQGRTYDLEERTAAFGERVFDFALAVERNPVTSPLISQLVSAATSIGANYCEADSGEFRSKPRRFAPGPPPTTVPMDGLPIPWPLPSIDPLYTARFTGLVPPNWTREGWIEAISSKMTRTDDPVVLAMLEAELEAIERCVNRRRN